MQADWTSGDRLGPTGIISNFGRLAHHKLVYEGWPEFDEGGSYSGPLPPLAAPVPWKTKQQSAPIASQSAMLPTAFCMKLMAILLDEWIALGAGRADTPEDGAQRDRHPTHAADESGRNVHTGVSERSGGCRRQCWFR